MTITSVPVPTAIALSDTTIIQTQSANLSASGGTSYIWDNSMTGANITVTPPTTTVFCVTVIDTNSCFDTACVTVTVEDCSKAGTLYLPNAFSPNGDGENDSLQIYYGSYQCIAHFRLVIYNRWGEKIYTTTDPAFKWSGVYNKGLMHGLTYQQPGGTEVFAYYMEAELIDGNKIFRKGNISLIR
jgi:gliding motility-associated-like protein